MDLIGVLPIFEEFPVFARRARLASLLLEDPSEPVMIKGMNEVAVPVRRIDGHELSIFGRGFVQLALLPIGPS